MSIFTPAPSKIIISIIVFLTKIVEDEENFELQSGGAFSLYSPTVLHFLRETMYCGASLAICMRDLRDG